MGYSDLGVNSVDDYGVKNDGLGYTDYMRAHDGKKENHNCR